VPTLTHVEYVDNGKNWHDVVYGGKARPSVKNIPIRDSIWDSPTWKEWEQKSKKENE
jgi:hypothetical protein